MTKFNSAYNERSAFPPSQWKSCKSFEVADLHNHPHILSLLPIMRGQPACPPGGQTSKTANADHPQISRNLGVAGEQAAPRVH